MSTSEVDAADLRVMAVEQGFALGWVFTPLNGKIPKLRGWQKRPPGSAEEAIRWAREGNVGLRTGAVSGVVAIDEDTAKGGSVAGLGLPETVTVNTGGGGRHLLYQSPDAGLPNSAGKLAPNVDVRGDGGQTVLVGSVHPDTGAVYEWAPGLSPDEVGLAGLPPAIVELLRAPKTAAKAKGGALERAHAAVAKAMVGERNDTLNRQAFLLGKHVAGGSIDASAARKTLHEAASIAGLDHAEVEKTIESGLSSGQREARARGERGEIRVVPGDLPRVVDEAEQALLHDGGPPVFEYAGSLVRMVRSPIPTVRQGFDRAGGPLRLIPLEAPYLVDRLTRASAWVRFDRRMQDWKAIDCPERVARTYLAREGLREAPQLIGILSAPTLRPDGSILCEPGYDPKTRLFLDIGGTAFDPIPNSPALSEARRALERLANVIAKFPWVAASDRSAALAAILTALIRPSLRTAPLFPFRAPKMASGKSLLVDVVAMLATGYPAAVMSQGKDEDEIRKRLLAVLMEGRQVVSIDNIERPLDDPVLCAILTQETWSDRILGVSRTATVPTSVTWMATGNNLLLQGDVTTRAVPCDLDPKCEHPEKRKFDVNLYKYIPKHRGELVAAGLTILRGYHCAGRPDQGLGVFGRFEEWSDWVRSALVWCGEADPCEGRSRIELYDPVRVTLQAVFRALLAKFGGEGVTAAQIANSGASDLLQHLLPVAGDGHGKLEVRRLGIWLAQQERRMEGGLVVERIGTRQGAAVWRVRSVTDGPGEGGAQ